MNQPQLWFLASNLPQPCKKEGRKPYSNIELLGGILQVLRSGCRWRDLDLKKRKGEASSITHWRRLQFWSQSKQFLPLWQELLKRLRVKRKLNIHILSLDGSFIPSFAFQDGSGYSGKQKKVGVKVSQVVDGLGIPLTVCINTGNTSDFTMAQQTINTVLVEKEYIRKAFVLADKGYDSASFRSFLLENGFKALIKRKRYTHSLETEDLLTLPHNQTIAKVRFVVERTFAWTKSFRRLKFRFDRTTRSFTAFLYLSSLVICVRKLLN